MVFSADANYALRWFAERRPEGVMPTVSADSAPLWIYKLAILALALWLAKALFGGLR